MGVRMSVSEIEAHIAAGHRVSTSPADGSVSWACKRARSYMTPCVEKDGEMARANDGACVGCGHKGVSQWVRPGADEKSLHNRPMADLSKYTEAPASPKHMTLVEILHALEQSPRSGKTEDTPEGTRYITVSDTLAKLIQASLAAHIGSLAGIRAEIRKLQRDMASLAHPEGERG